MLVGVRALSDAALRLVNEANHLSTRSSWKRVDVTPLDRVARTGEWVAIPRIISLALDRRREVAEAAGQAVEKLCAGVGPRNLGTLDRAFRDLSPYLHSEYMPWCRLDVNDLDRLDRLSAGAALLRLAMCHPSGYVRAEAIRRSVSFGDGREIPFLLLRANDWVLPVRDLAQATLRTQLRPERLRDLIRALPLIEQMRGWGRLGNRRIMDEIDAIFCGEQATAPLTAGLSSSDRLVRRGCIRRLLDSPYVDRRDVFRRALADRDPVVRVWASRTLAHAEPELFGAFADQLLEDTIGSIRFNAAWRLRALNWPLPWQNLLVMPTRASEASPKRWPLLTIEIPPRHIPIPVAGNDRFRRFSVAPRPDFCRQVDSAPGPGVHEPIAEHRDCHS